MQGFLFLNFKTYREATGKNALELAKLAGVVAEKTGVTIVLVPQLVDLKEICKSVPLGVFAQHSDPISSGSHTGFVLPLALKEAGAKGVVLNHAENKRSDKFVKDALIAAKSEGLKVMVCAESVKRAVAVARFSPDFIAIEPPELIGGNVSVSTAKPGLITGSVKKIKKINPEIKVITGAGIKTARDAKLAVESGSIGVFVASGIVLAKNQKKAMTELALGLKSGFV